MFIQRVTAESIAVSGTGSTAETTITVPATFTPVAGAVYDILISTQVPEATDGTIIVITNGTGEWNLLQGMTGNYARSRQLGWRKVIRAAFFDDPAHFNFVGVRG
ncbi:MAG: hypothetical protein J6Y02_03755 [Pseudobutyrivibrio sp.]|nr:hypothetical protein [Pseudobutyrivibrio sp.]